MIQLVVSARIRTYYLPIQELLLNYLDARHLARVRLRGLVPPLKSLTEYLYQS
jgi:hypothetical protein